MRSASPGGFTDRLTLSEDLAVSRHERRRQDGPEMQTPKKPPPTTAKTTLKPPPTTPHKPRQRQKQKHLKLPYRIPTVEDASSSGESDVDHLDESVSESSSPVEERKAARLKIPSPLVSDNMCSQKKSSIFVRRGGAQKPVHLDSGYNSYASGVSSGRRTSFNDRVHVRIFTNPDKDTHHDPERRARSRPVTAPGEASRTSAWATVDSPSFGCFRDDRTYSSKTRPVEDVDVSRHPERLRRQMYEGGISSLAQEYLQRPSSVSRNRHPASDIHHGGYSELAQEYLSPSASRRQPSEQGRDFVNTPTTGTHNWKAEDSMPRASSTWQRYWTHHMPSTAHDFPPSASDYYSQPSHRTGAASYASQMHREPKLPETGFVIGLVDDESDGRAGQTVSPASTKVHTGTNSSSLKPGVLPGAVAAA